jgi:hypothetical protein
MSTGLGNRKEDRQASGAFLNSHGKKIICLDVDLRDAGEYYLRFSAAPYTRFNQWETVGTSMALALSPIFYTALRAMEKIMALV